MQKIKLNQKKLELDEKPILQFVSFDEKLPEMNRPLVIIFEDHRERFRICGGKLVDINGELFVLTDDPYKGSETDIAREWCYCPYTEMYHELEVVINNK